MDVRSRILNYHTHNLRNNEEFIKDQSCFHVNGNDILIPEFKTRVAITDLYQRKSGPRIWSTHYSPGIEPGTLQYDA